jgi:uncharacterized protein YciI
MKWLALVVCAAACSSAPRSAAAPVTPDPAQPAAAEFQMKQYIFVVLRRGPAWTPEKTPETKQLFEGHMANIIAMEKAGKLILAGPMEAPESDRAAIAGIFIFDNVDRAGVDKLLANDPAIAAQRLVPEIHTWYGPAGLTYAGKK